MNKRELIQLVSEKLGAANNEIKVAFDTFLQKVADHAEVDSAIRIPEIGIFHLKKKDSRSGTEYNLLFLPLKYNPQAKNKILSFNVKTTKEPEVSEGESAFNISIGKPLIPIIGVNRRDFMVHSSYLMLQKSFEERTDELLAKAVQLNDLKIDPRLIDTDDDVIDFLEDYGQYEQLGDDTADIPWDFGNLSEENLEPEQPSGSDNIKDHDELIVDDVDIVIPADELPDFKNTNAEDAVGKISEDETDKISDQDDFVLNDELPVLEEAKTDEEYVTSDKEFTEQDIASIPIEDFFEEKSLENENAVQDETSKDLDEFKPDDHLKLDHDEFKLDHDEFRIDEVDLGFTEEEPTAVTSQKDESEPPEQNEHGFSEPEYVEPEYDKSVDAFFSNERSFEEGEQEKISPRMEIVTPFKPGNDYVRVDEKPDFRVKYGLWFWVIMITFILITFGGLYYFIFYNSRSNKDVTQNNSPAEQTIIERDYDVPVSIIPQADSAAAGESNIESEPGNDIEENRPVVTKTEEPLQQQSQSTAKVDDTKNTLIKEYIFSDGNKFTVQVSSWRTKSVAEDQVRNLQADGLPSYISEFIAKNGQKWYRVRVGEYSSLSEAEDFLGKNVNKLFK